MGLTAEEEEYFVANGFLRLAPTVSSPSIHDAIYTRLQELFAHGADPGESGLDDQQRMSPMTRPPGPPGNEVYPQAAGLAEVLSSDEVMSACNSLLGEHWHLHPHRRCHESKPGRCDQYLHQDSYKGLSVCLTVFLPGPHPCTWQGAAFSARTGRTG